MGRVYAREEDGTSHLVRVECDSSDAFFLPGDEAMSEWLKSGFADRPGDDRYDTYTCPKCRTGLEPIEKEN